MPTTFNERFRTLGWRTEAYIERDRCAFEERDGFVIMRTPSNPGYFMGNMLLFDRAPAPGDEARWPRLFDEAFGADERVKHASFAWSFEDEDTAHIGAFVERGYAFQDHAVLTAEGVREFPVPDGLHVRPLQDDRDWSEQLALGLATREDQYEAGPYATFKAAQVAYHRHLAQAYGAWIGAFDGSRLAGSCGIFPSGPGLARYQDVGVLPGYRNRGIARCLIGAAARHARELFGAHTFVIVADVDGIARTIYERAGFKRTQREGALWIALR
jgi:ribosomal protein S18 acetylase RimI-like enzyme